MTTMEVAHFNSLLATRGAVGGNKAGVAFVSNGFPSDRAMTDAAKQVGFSETAFVKTSDDLGDNVRVRFFTPEGEVDLCGHATIAVFTSMPWNRSYQMHTKNAVLQVTTDQDGRVCMDQNLPRFEDIDPHMASAALDALGLEPHDIIDGIPLMVVSTGLADLFVGVKTRAILHDTMKPDMAKISEVSKTLGTIGFHVFTLDTLDGFTAECRNFAPLFGIDEEAATGTSSGALGSLLCRFGKCASSSGVQRMVFLQGGMMGLPSSIEAIVSLDEGQITRVSIAGIAEKCGSQLVNIISLS